MVSCSHPVNIRGEALFSQLDWQLCRCNVFPFGSLFVLSGGLPVWPSATAMHRSRKQLMECHIGDFVLRATCVGYRVSWGCPKLHELLQMLSDLTTESKLHTTKPNAIFIMYCFCFRCILISLLAPSSYNGALSWLHSSLQKSADYMHQLSQFRDAPAIS